MQAEQPTTNNPKHQTRWGVCVALATLIALASPAARAWTAPLDDAEAALDAGRLEDAASAFSGLLADTDPLTKARASLGLGVIAKQRFDLAAAKARLQEAEKTLIDAKAADDWLAVVRFELAAVILSASPSAEEQAQATALLDASLQGFTASAKGTRREDPSLLLWQAATRMRLGTLAIAGETPSKEALNQGLNHFQLAATAAKGARDLAREADALFEQARVLWALGDLSLARERLEAARALFRDADDKLAIGRCQTTSGQLWLLQGQPKEAAATFKLAFDEFDSFSRTRPQEAAASESDLRRYELIASQGLAQALVQSDTPADAKAHLQRAKALADGLGASAQWLPLIALTEVELDLATAAKDANTSIAELASLCSSFKEPQSGARSRCLLLQARLLIEQKKAPEARPLLDALRASPDPITQKAALTLLTQAILAAGASPSDGDLLREILATMPPEDPARVPLLVALAQAAITANDLSTAHALLEDAQNTLEAANDPKARAAILLEDTLLWIQEENWSRAKRQVTLALGLLEGLPDAKLEHARALLVTARMHQARGKPDDALEFAQPAIATFEAAGDTTAAAEAALICAAAYDADGKSAEALAALEGALKHLATAPETSSIARDAYLSAARLQRQAGRTEDARTSFDKALKFARAQSHPPSIALASAALADLLITEGKHADAIPLLTDALSVFSATTDLPNQAHTQMALGFAYKATGDKPKAEAAFTEAARLYKDVRGGRPDRKKAEAELEALQATP